MRKKKFPQRIGSFLEGYFQKRGWSSTLKEYRIWTHWEEIVGPQLSLRSQPLRLRHQTLTIVVANASWLTQLQFMTQELIKKIRIELRVHLTEIRFVVGKIEHPQEIPLPPVKVFTPLSDR